jgi:uncharacterized protein
MPSTEVDSRKYSLNFFRQKDFQGKKLLVTITGAYDMLTGEEYDRLMSHRLTPELFERFKKSTLIVTGDNKEDIIDRYRCRKALLDQGASLHIVVPTLRCNENCVYCHALSRSIDAAGFDMDSETARKTVDFIFQTPAKGITIEFQGGEPLLAFERVKEIVEYARLKNEKAKKELGFTVVTNLSLMDEEKLDFFVKNRVDICTSLDGPKWLHDKNRPMAGGSSYEQVSHWLGEMRKRKIAINALLSVTRFSLAYAKEIVDEYVRQGFRTIWFRMINNLGCAANSWETIGFSPEEFLKFWREGVDYVYENTDMMESSTSLIVKKALGKEDPGMLDLMSPCGAAIGQIAYNYDGNIYTCDEARMIKDEMFRLGNVHTDKYRDIMISPKVCSLIEASVNECFFCDTCLYQPYCGLCPVSTYAQTSTLVPNLPDFRCKVLTGEFEHVFEMLAEPVMREKIKRRYPDLFKEEKKG